MHVLTPEAWNGVGIVSVIIVLAFWLAVGFARGWIVLGKNHREMQELMTQMLQTADKRADKDAETIAVQAQTIAESNVAGQLQAHILQAIKDVASESTS